MPASPAVLRRRSFGRLGPRIGAGDQREIVRPSLRRQHPACLEYVPRQEIPGQAKGIRNLARCRRNSAHRSAEEVRQLQEPIAIAFAGGSADRPPRLRRYISEICRLARRCTAIEVEAEAELLEHLQLE